MSQRSIVNALLYIALLVLAILIGGLIGAFYVSKAFLSGMAAATGITTFFGFLILSTRIDGGSLSDRGMRLAITASVVVTFLVIAGTSAFFGGHLGKMPEISSTLMTSFTSIVGVVVAFYFGASAYTESQEKKGKN